MKVPGESRGICASLLPILERVPVLSCYAKTRGWNYLISWLHRFTGIGLVMIMTVHMVTLLSLPTPGVTYAKMVMVVSPVCLFLAWAASLVVGFHALNGGRLILYEIFGSRSDADMIRWVFGLTASYAVMVGLVMIMKNQHASAFFFWLAAFFSGGVAAYVVASRIWGKRHSLLWKLQRISGAFLFVTAPAYLLFAYLGPGEAAGAAGAIALTQNPFTRLVAVALATGALYHAGYGLFSIVADYAPSPATRAGMTAIVVVIIAMLAVLGFRLILSV